MKPQHCYFQGCVMARTPPRHWAICGWPEQEVEKIPPQIFPDWYFHGIHARHRWDRKRRYVQIGEIFADFFLVQALNFFRPRAQFNQADTVGVWEGQWNRRDEGELWIPFVQIQLPEERPSQTDRGDQRDETGPRAGSQWDWAGWLDQCDAELQQGLSGAIFAQEKTYRR